MRDSEISEEIKRNLPMPELMAQYGVKIGRNGMCSCPWHTDKRPSMKVYKDGAKCFSCNWSGDIFSFVMQAENCSFKDAFRRLGGSYEQFSTELKRSQFQAKIKARKAQEEKQRQDEQRFLSELTSVLKIIDVIIDQTEPYSDLWCIAKEYQPALEDAFNQLYIYNNKVEKLHVYRKCKQFRQKLIQ